jgi:hypothetical protein
MIYCAGPTPRAPITAETESDNAEQLDLSFSYFQKIVLPFSPRDHDESQNTGLHRKTPCHRSHLRNMRT